MTSTPKERSDIGDPRAIGRVGALARILVGVAFLAAGIVAGGGWIAWWQVVLGLVGLPVALTAAQLVRMSFTRQQLTLTDHVAACLNCAVLVALLGLRATRDATLVFLGASLLLAALRGYSGCETLAISNWLLRRNDQVGCLLFSPLDHLEAHRSERRPRDR